MRIVYSALTVFLLSVVIIPVYADGTHGVKVTVINKAGAKIEIMTYNSKDSSMTVPHKVYYVDAGGTRIAKAHGQGTGKLKMTVTHAGKIYNACYASDKTVIKARGRKWLDGETVTVAWCETVSDSQG